MKIKYSIKLQNPRNFRQMIAGSVAKDKCIGRDGIFWNDTSYKDRKLMRFYSR